MQNPSSSNVLSQPDLYRRLVEKITDYAIYMISLDGIVSSWNNGAQRFKGYTADEIIGTHFSAFYPEEDRNSGKPDRALKIARETGKYEEEGWRIRKDGNKFWASVVIDPVFDEQGILVGYAKITRDITDRKNLLEAEERARDQALKNMTQEYENLVRLFEQAPGFICFFRGPDHVYELANEAHAKLAQHRDIMGKPVREALPELEGQGFFELLDNVYDTAQPFVGTAWPLMVEPYPGGQAEKRFIDFVYQPILGPDKTVIGIFSQGNDVTDRVLAENQVKQKQAQLESLIDARTEALKQAEAALEQARTLEGDKTHLLNLFDQAPGFICFLAGKDHRFELANRAYYQLVGHRDLIGLPVRQALPEVEGQGFFELLDHVCETGEPYIGKGVPIFLTERPGSPPKKTFLDFIYQPIFNDKGKVTGIFVQGSDVTEQKQAQDELKRYQTDLENLVAEKTKSLEQTQAALLRSQKLESIGKLTGGVAHDFNNILQVISGNLQLLQTSVAGAGIEQADKRLENSLDAVERGSKLSSQLLAFARRQPLQPVVVNLGRIIKNMNHLLGRALGEPIHIETVVAAGTWHTMVDPHQLENVILNLAINARDAMPDGGKLTIEIGNAMLDDDYVTSKSDVPAGQYVMVAVSDTGTGMTPEVLERACEPFFTTKREGEGTGLGLSMAYGFVKQSGGHFSIYSEVGSGTTIKMYFPRTFEVEQPVSEPSNRPAVGGTETILVVEDDPLVQATVVEMLTSLGYKVLKADNAESALVIIKSGLPIDLLFTDVVMPGKLRSPELARQAKQIIPDIEVLFTSGYTQNAIVHGGRLDPGVHLISKPYRREQLARKIRHLLVNRQQALQAKHGLLPQAEASAVFNGVRVLVVEDIAETCKLTCEMLTVLGYRTQGAPSAETALQMLDRGERFDILFTDFTLPGMDGLQLAKQARQKDPALKVIFTSGYGELFEETPPFRYVSLPKPYDIEKLEESLRLVKDLPEAA